MTEAMIVALLNVAGAGTRLAAHGTSRETTPLCDAGTLDGKTSPPAELVAMD